MGNISFAQLTPDQIAPIVAFGFVGALALRAFIALNASRRYQIGEGSFLSVWESANSAVALAQAAEGRTLAAVIFACLLTAVAGWAKFMTGEGEVIVAAGVGGLLMVAQLVAFQLKKAVVVHAQERKTAANRAERAQRSA